MKAKIATLTALRRTNASTWRAYDSAETLKHIADGHQDVDAILRYSTELVIRLEHALKDAQTLEEIARHNATDKHAAASLHHRVLQEIA